MVDKETATAWAAEVLIPFLDESAGYLGAPADRLVLASVTRRAAQAGIALQDLVDEVEHHYNHQVSFINRRKH